MIYASTRVGLHNIYSAPHNNAGKMVNIIDWALTRGNFPNSRILQLQLPNKLCFDFVCFSEQGVN